MRRQRKVALALAASALVALVAVSLAPIRSSLWFALPGLLSLVAGLAWPSPRHAEDRRWAAVALLIAAALGTSLWWGLADMAFARPVAGVIAALTVLAASGLVSMTWTLPPALSGSWRDVGIAALALLVAILALGTAIVLLAVASVYGFD